jgi:putative Holliday junction resolvase
MNFYGENSLMILMKIFIKKIKVKNLKMSYEKTDPPRPAKYQEQEETMSCSLSYSNQLPFFSKRASTNLLFPNFTTSSLQLDSDKPCRRRLRALLSIQEIPPNALRRKNDPLWRGGFSLGVDLGLSRSGVALSKGFTVRPLTVLLPYILSIFFLKI